MTDLTYLKPKPLTSADQADNEEKGKENPWPSLDSLVKPEYLLYAGCSRQSRSKRRPGFRCRTLMLEDTDSTEGNRVSERESSERERDRSE